MIHLVKFLLDRLKTLLIFLSFLARILLDLSGLINSIYDRSPCLLQCLRLNRTAGCHACGHFGLRYRILRIFDQHLICLLIKCRKRFRLDTLAFQHDRLCKRLLKHRQRDDKRGIDLSHQVHIAESHCADHRDRLHRHILRSPKILRSLFKHHQCLIQRRQFKLDRLVSGSLHICPALRDICFQLSASLLSCQDISYQLMIIAYIGIKHSLQISVRLFDLGFIFFKLNIDLIDLITHSMIFIEDFIQLFLKTSEQLPKQSRIFVDLLQIKLIHDLRKCVQHLTGLI